MRCEHPLSYGGPRSARLRTRSLASSHTTDSISDRLEVGARVVLDGVGLLALLLLCGSSLCHRQNSNQCRWLGLVHVYAVTQRSSEAVELDLHDIAVRKLDAFAEA